MRKRSFSQHVEPLPPGLALHELMLRARQGDPCAGQQLAELVERVIAEPERRVGAAFGLRCRGGDPVAAARAARDAGFRELDALIGGGERSVHRRAAALVRIARRYRPAPGDVAIPERSALQRIADSGLPVPDVRTMRRIISPGTCQQESDVGQANSRLDGPKPER